MAVVLFIFILCVLVLVHEYGHFISAKKSGMHVEEFGIGYPPRACVLFKKNETLYTLNWIPFGGFVKIAQEDGATDVVDPKGFTSKKWWVKSIVLSAGVIMNFLLAWLLFSVAFSVGIKTELTNDQSASDAKVYITHLESALPAKEAGLSVGDEVVSITIGDTVLADPSVETLKDLLKEKKDTPAEFSVISKDGENKTIEVKPLVKEGSIQPILGIAISRIGTVRLPFYQAVGKGFTTSGYIVGQIFSSFGTLIHDTFLGKADLSTLTGPVGIVGVVGDAYRFGLVQLLTLTAMISLNLAVLNILPFPALDGGRLLFVLIEAGTKKTIPAKVQGIVNMIGFLLLISLMIFITYKDIAKLILK